MVTHKLINRIPGSGVLMLSLPGSSLRRRHVESLGKPRDVNKLSQSLPCRVLTSTENLENHKKKFHAWKNHGI